MNTLRPEFPTAALCRALEISRSGFYAWQKRRPSMRQQQDEILKIALRAAHMRTRKSYGCRRLKEELAEEGFIAGRDRIARLRHPMDIHCKQKRKFCVTTESKHLFPVADNILNQVFTSRRTQ